MLNFASLALRRGPRLLLEDVSFTIHRGQKIGLTGANGTGKSSLFALIRGELGADRGELKRPPKLTIAHVAQETPATDRPAIDYVMDGDAELRQVQAQLAHAEQESDGHRQAELHGRLETIGGYTARARAAKLLHGLGFQPDQDERPVLAFSGGWRMRLNLAQALMCRSDLLLLDEPTNHLDLDAVLWLEDWLRGYAGTLLLISHDRDFLDAVVNLIAHIEHQGVTLYTGNYSDFERQRAERLAQQTAAYRKQQREIAHIEDYVRRFRAKATKARQAQSRLKALERMERIAPAHVDSPFHFEFRQPERLPSPLLGLERIAIGYGDTAIVEHIQLSLLPGDRIGLLGHNGAGKSTLIKHLAGTLPALPTPDSQRREAKDLRIGYFAQHQLEQLDPDASALLHLKRLDAQAREQELRDFLGGFGFGFHGERVDEPVAPFSGGEKARLALALIVYRKPNLLLLDEPTNHLDLEMRLALTLALQGFQGAVVLVSHDRHLLRTVCDRLLLVHDRRLRDFDGDLDDYPRWLAEQRAGKKTDATPVAASGVETAADKKERKRREAERRKRLQPMRDRIQRLEREMEKLTGERDALDARLADGALYETGERERLQACMFERARVQERLEGVEEEWLNLSEEVGG